MSVIATAIATSWMKYIDTYGYMNTNYSKLSIIERGLDIISKAF